MMSLICLLKKNELEGTDYFEFLPGTHNGKWWNDESAYLQTDEGFGFIWFVFDHYIKEFDYDGESKMEREDTQKIISALQELKHVMDQSRTAQLAVSMLPYGEFPMRSMPYIWRDWKAHQSQVENMIDDLCSWLTEVLKKHSEITILGM